MLPGYGIVGGIEMTADERPVVPEAVRRATLVGDPGERRRRADPEIAAATFARRLGGDARAWRGDGDAFAARWPDAILGP